MADVVGKAVESSQVAAPGWAKGVEQVVCFVWAIRMYFVGDVKSGEAFVGGVPSSETQREVGIDKTG